MRSTFFGIEMGRRALSAHRTVADVVGHNLANAGTEGYRKQNIALTATQPYGQSGQPSLSVGTGVRVGDIARRQNRYLDREIQQRTGAAKMWDTRSQILHQVQDILAEPGDSGINSVLDRFFNAWQDVAIEPDNSAVRTAVLERGQELGDALGLAQNQVANMASNIEERAATRVNKINNLLDELEGLNAQLVAIDATDMRMNDLLDRRDMLVEELSSLVSVSSRDGADGGIRLVVDGIPVMDSYSSRRLEYAGVEGDGSGSLGNVALNWTHGSQTAIPWEPSQAGELGALVGLRNEEVPGVLADLGALADALRTGVNAIHQDGYDLEGNPGGAFFSETVDPGVLRVEDLAPSEVAAAAIPDGAPGDGDNAQAISDFRQDPEAIDGTDPGDFLRSLVSHVGVRTEQSDQLGTNTNNMLMQLENQRDAITGVSIDEELTHLITAQNSFNAAARLVQTWDEMLDMIVNGLVR